MKKILTSILLTGFALAAKSATFESTGATSGWNSATSWVVTSGTDADNIPDVDDDVTIKSGHNITMSTTSLAKSLVIELTATLNTNNQYLSLRGSFTNNGTITKKLYFILAYANITISSTSAMNIGYMNIVSATVTLPATNSIVGTGVTILIRSNSTFNNNGSVNVAGISRYGTTGNTWNNLNGSSLTLNGTTPAADIPAYNNSATSTITMNINATILYNITYHNLVLAGSGSTKTAGSNITINGNLTNNNGVTMNMANNTLNLKGNLSNSGTMSNLATVNFNGTTTQNINTTGSLSIANLNSASTSIVNLATGTYNVTAGTALSGSLIVAAPVTLDLNSNTLNLGGSLTNTGAISNLVDCNFNGSGTAQNISTSGSLAFDDLTCSNASGVTLTAGSYTIDNSLTVSSGNFNVGSNLLTMLSDATTTAYIGNSSGTISGSMKLQRYVSARPTNYHDFSSVVAMASIDDWDNEMYMSIDAPDDTPGYAGGDGSSGGSYSVFTYNNSTAGYDSVLTGTTLTVGLGYDIYLGDDPVNWPGRVIDLNGTPNNGTVFLPVVFGTDGWNLVGNPFQAHIDWSQVVSNSNQLDPTVYMLDNSGTYQAYTNPVIAPGQGFMCYINNGAGTAVVPQSAKTTSTSSAFNRTNSLTRSDIKLRLSSSINPCYHEIGIAYDKDANIGFEAGKDLPFFKSNVKQAPSITFVDKDKKFIRNYLNPEANLISIPLELKAPIDGNYTIDIIGLVGNTEYDKANLLDKNTGKLIEISDANPLTMYLESKSVYTNYTLVLSKSGNINNPALTEDNISIFSTSGFINVKGNAVKLTAVKIEVMNLLGQTILESNGELVSDASLTIPTESLTSDIYIVKVNTSEGKQISKKVVVSK